MDSLHYYYYANTNQLKRITDAILPNAFTDNENRIIDIDSQPDSNYVYDSIGNLVQDKQENIDTIKWNVYGKIEEIIRRATATVPASNIKYTYDAMGNRISQVVTTGTTKNYTWYVRDAQGNILTTYSDLGALDFKLSDRFLYGSSRLGTIAVNESANGEPGSTEFYYENRKFSYDRGYKQYELTNHLGNVLATVSDRKFGVSSGGSSLIQYYDPHIVTAQDYYPFGMLSRVALPNNNKSYRFGFNGQEMNNDVKGGLGNSYTAQFWEYDSRIGRRWNLDPKPTVGISSYSTFFNSPIWFNDKFGDSSIVDDKGYMLHYDRNDKDLRVFMKQDGKLSYIGKLGDKIDASVWFKNLLKENSLYASVLLDPLLFGDNFKTRVQQDGVWDYKYRSGGNQNKENQKLPHHILGIAFQRKDKDVERGIGDLPDTKFTFDGKTGRAEDLNNLHFGVVAKAFNFPLFTEEVLLRTAGGIEMGKWAEDFAKHKRPTPQVPPSWRPTISITNTHYIEHGMKIKETNTILLPPYGDNPVDHEWIKKGFEYYKAHRKEFPGNFF